MASPPPPRLDRAAYLRKDTERLMRALDAPGTLLVPVYKDKSFLTTGSEQRGAMLSPDTASALVDAATEIVWLGKVGDRDCFALDVSGLSAPLTHPALAGRVELTDLRLSAGLLPAEEAEILAYARGMLYWHQRHRFCGVCGRETKPREGGHVRECVGDKLKHFPRTDPAVMVLVAHGDRCVLARQPGWPQGMQSVVAGFVEPGESLEGTVVREVREELGLDVVNVRYASSQPWPFPSSLMLGFRADATSEDIVVDHDELESAAWYSRADLANPKGFFYPPPYSLAHQLIRAFVAEG